MASGMVSHRETPNSSPTPAMAANSVISAPIADRNRVPADSSAQPRPNRSRMSAPWPVRVTTPSRTVISCTTYRIGMRMSWGRIIR